MLLCICTDTLDSKLQGAKEDFIIEASFIGKTEPLTVSCTMLTNGLTYLKNLAVLASQDF